MRGDGGVFRVVKILGRYRKSVGASFFLLFFPKSSFGRSLSDLLELLLPSAQRRKYTYPFLYTIIYIITYAWWQVVGQDFFLLLAF